MNQQENKDLRIIIFFVVIALILVNSIVYFNVYELNIILVLINAMMVVVNVIAIFLYGTHKTIAYLAGLISFLFSIFFHFIITSKFIMGSEKFAIILTVCFIYFIYDEFGDKSRQTKS